MNASIWASMIASGALAACASAGTGGGDNPDSGFIHVTDGPSHHVDAPPGVDSPVQIDAPPVDTGGGSHAVTLTETNDNNVAAGASIACAYGDGSTADNTWYRAFQLSDFGITGSLQIAAVHFGVEEATGVPLTISIGTFTGSVGGETLDLSGYNQLATTNLTVSTTNEQAVALAATIPAGGKFVVSVAAPDEDAVATFYLGCTTGNENDPGYLTTTGCGGVNTPEDPIALGGTGGPIIYVTGIAN